MQIDLHALATMSENERANAIDDLVESLVAEGIVDDQADELRGILESISAVLAQRLRPN